jgi:hypothetical protein
MGIKIDMNLNQITHLAIGSSIETKELTKLVWAYIRERNLFHQSQSRS